MAQWGFFFNQDRCVGCKTCMLACKNWNEERRGDAKANILNMDNFTATPPKAIDQVGGSEPNVHVDKNGVNNDELYRKFYMKEEWRKVTTIETGATALNRDGTFDVSVERRYLSLSCNHCEKPVCAEVCPVANIVKDAATGIVMVGGACISCGRCKAACPWDAPQFYDDNFTAYGANNIARPRMTKCNLCIDRINIGLKPACVASCWNRALDAGPIDELRAKYGSAPFAYRTMETLSPEFTELDTAPCIFFKEKTIKSTE